MFSVDTTTLNDGTWAAMLSTKQLLNSSHWTISVLTVGLSVSVAFFGIVGDNGTAYPGQRDRRRGSTIRSGQSPIRVPIELDNNHVILRGRINNSEPLRIALDTGAGISLLDSSRAELLGLRIEPGRRTAGCAGSVESGSVHGVSVSLGVDLFNQSLVTLPLSSVGSADGAGLDAVVGYDLFTRFVVEIDYAAGLIGFYDPKNYQYHGPGEIVPITMRDNHPYVSAKLMIEGHDAIEGRFVIDTGSSLALLLQSAFVAEHDLRRSAPTIIESRGECVGGSIPLPTGRVKRLLLGRFAIDNPLAVFSKAGEFAAPGSAGNIGGMILSRFKVIFDYSRQRIILEPNDHFAESYEFDMSGMTLIKESNNSRAVKITRVLEHSPAAEVGLRAGDVIVAVDRQPAVQFSLETLAEMFRQEGREYQLTILRRETSLGIKLKLRRLI